MGEERHPIRSEGWRGLLSALGVFVIGLAGTLVTLGVTGSLPTVGLARDLLRLVPTWPWAVGGLFVTGAFASLVRRDVAGWTTLVCATLLSIGGYLWVRVIIARQVAGNTYLVDSLTWQLQVAAGVVGAVLAISAGYALFAWRATGRAVPGTAAAWPRPARLEAGVAILVTVAVAAGLAVATAGSELLLPSDVQVQRITISTDALVLDPLQLRAGDTAFLVTTQEAVGELRLVQPDMEVSGGRIPAGAYEFVYVHAPIAAGEYTWTTDGVSASFTVR